MGPVQKKPEERTTTTNWGRYAIAAVGIGIVSSCGAVLDVDRKYDNKMTELKASSDYDGVRNLDNAAKELGRARDFTGAATPECLQRLQNARTSLIAAAGGTRSMEVRGEALEFSEKLQAKLCSGTTDNIHSLASEVEDLGRKEVDMDPKAKAVETGVGQQIHDQAVFRIGMVCLAALGLAIAGMF